MSNNFIYLDLNKQRSNTRTVRNIKLQVGYTYLIGWNPAHRFRTSCFAEYVSCCALRIRISVHLDVLNSCRNKRSLVFSKGCEVSKCPKDWYMCYESLPLRVKTKCFCTHHAWFCHFKLYSVLCAVLVSSISATCTTHVIFLVCRPNNNYMIHGKIKSRIAVAKAAFSRKKTILNSKLDFNL